MFPGPERPDPRGFGGRDLGAGRYADRRLGERSPSPSRVTQCDYCPSSHNSSAIAGRHAHGRFRVRHRARRHRRRDPTAHPGCSDPCLVRHAVCGMSAHFLYRWRCMTMQLSSRSRRPTGTADHRAGLCSVGPGKPWRAVGRLAGTWSRRCPGMCRGSERVNESSRRWPERK